MSRKNERLGHLETEVSEVTTLLRDNVEKVVERGERIGDLQDRTEDLSYQSVEFRKSAVRAKRRACWQNCRLTCIIILIVLAVIAVVVIIVVVEKPWASSDDHKNSTLTALSSNFE